MRTLAWGLGALVVLCSPRPTAARGFEPWLTADPLYERVGLLSQRQATPQELARARTQLQWCQTALGEGHASTAQAQAQLGLLLLQLGDLEHAETTLVAARDRLRALPREAEGRTLLRVLLALSTVADLRGRRQEAQQLGLEALALRRRIGDAEPAGLLEMQLALLYLRGGAAAQAEALLRPLLNTLPLTARPDLRRAATLHDVWAEAQWQIGRHEQAEAAQRAAIKALEQAVQPGAALPAQERQALLGDLTAVQNNLAVHLARLGREAEAEPLLTRAVALRQRLYGERDARTALLQRNLAALLWLAGQPARAEAPLQAAALTTSDPMTLLWLGALYGEIAPAGPRAAAALRKAAAGTGEVALLAQEQLVQLHRQLGRLDEAQAQAQALLEARRKAHGPTDPALLRAAELLAAVAAERNQPELAEEVLQRALAGASGPGAPPPQSPLLALLRGRLAALLLARPVPRVAGPAMAEPLGAAPRRMQGAQLLAQALDAVATLAHQAAPLGASWLRTALGQSAAALAGTLLPLGGDGSAALPAELAGALLRATDAPVLGSELAAEVQHLASREPAAEQLLALWRQRAQALLQAQPAQPERGPTITAQELALLEKSIHAAEQEVARRSPAFARLLPRRGLDAARIDQWLGRRLGGLVVFVRLSSRAAAAPAPAPAGLTRAGQALPPLRGPAPPQEAPRPGEPRDRYAALVLRPGEAARIVDLGEAARIDGSVERLGQLVDTQRDVQPELLQLGQLLAQPIVPYLPATGRLYIVAPPELAGLPFGALPVGGALLTSRGPVQVLARLGDAVEPPPERPPPANPQEPLQRLLLLGAPLLREPLPYLPKVWPPQLGHGEMAEVNQLLRQHRYDPRGGPVTGLAATKTRLRAWLPSRVVHLLAPLVVLPDGPETAAQERALGQLRQRPLSLPLGALLSPRLQLPPLGRAAVALAGFSYPGPAGAPPRTDDGLLPPEELAHIDLRRTSLMVLSGPLLHGPARLSGAVLQLERAALRAGAGQVVVTLWRPPDPAARQLMGQLYRAWLRSGDATEAVREVQLAMHARGQPPLLWAGLRASRR